MKLYICLVSEEAPERSRVRTELDRGNLTARHRDMALALLRRGLQRFPLLRDDVVSEPEGEGGILCTMPGGLITAVALGEFRTVADEAVAYITRITN